MYNNILHLFIRAPADSGVFLKTNARHVRATHEKNPRQRIRPTDQFFKTPFFLRPTTVQCI